MAKNFDEGNGRPWKNANQEETYKKEVFEGIQQGVQRKPKLNRIVTRQIKSINKTLTSVSEKTPVREDSPSETYGHSSGSSAREKNIRTDNGSLIASDSLRTPVRKTPSPPDNCVADSSGSTATNKSITPTLTDLENSVHYDCRLDKVLRVAIDYALPEELR